MFAHTYDEQTMDERRELTYRRINAIIEKEFLTLADVSVIDFKHEPLFRN